jgi:hypothetical protein
MSITRSTTISKATNVPNPVPKLIARNANTVRICRESDREEVYRKEGFAIIAIPRIQLIQERSAP